MSVVHNSHADYLSRKHEQCGSDLHSLFSSFTSKWKQQNVREETGGGEAGFS